MWKKNPDDSGFYWLFYYKDNILNKVVCQYEKVSKIVLFPGGGFTGIPLEHLDSLNAFWNGPLNPPEETKNESN